jgi:hypothetical protein
MATATLRATVCALGAEALSLLTTPAMTHTLCLDNAQTYHFQPNGDYSWDSGRESTSDILVTRYNVTHITRDQPRGEITGCWVMPRKEARLLWSSLLKNGAFRP